MGGNGKERERKAKRIDNPDPRKNEMFRTPVEEHIGDSQGVPLESWLKLIMIHHLQKKERTHCICRSSFSDTQQLRYCAYCVV